MNGIEAAPKSLVILIAASLPKVHGCGQGFIQRESFWVGGGGSSRKWVWLYIHFHTAVPNYGGKLPPLPVAYPELWGYPGTYTLS